MAFGIWGAVNGAASAVGPIIGGLLTANFGWRWIFLVNLPVSVVAVALTLRVVTESRDPHPRRVDLPGMATFTVAAAALTYALIRGAWGSGETIALLAVAARRPSAFVVAERRSAAPMLDLRLLRNPVVHRDAPRGRAALRGRLGGHDLPVAVAAVGARPERDQGGPGRAALRGGRVPGLRAGRPVPAPDVAAVDGRHRAAGDRGRRARPRRWCGRTRAGPWSSPAWCWWGSARAWPWPRSPRPRWPPCPGSRRAWRAAR